MNINSFPTRRACCTIASLALLVSLPSAAADEARIPMWLTGTYGYGQRVDLYGVGAMWGPSWGPERFARLGFEWRFAADLNYWAGHSTASSDRTLWDIGLTPYMRWNASGQDFQNMFIEAGVGPHLLSQTRIGVGNEHWRNFSTAFQFGSRLAVGVKLGDKGHEVALYVQHVSNAKIKDPNDGLTYYGVVVRLPLELR